VLPSIDHVLFLDARDETTDRVREVARDHCAVNKIICAAVVLRDVREDTEPLRGARLCQGSTVEIDQIVKHTQTTDALWPPEHPCSNASSQDDRDQGEQRELEYAQLFCLLTVSGDEPNHSRGQFESANDEQNRVQCDDSGHEVTANGTKNGVEEKAERGKKHESHPKPHVQHRQVAHHRLHDLIRCHELLCALECDNERQDHEQSKNTANYAVGVHHGGHLSRCTHARTREPLADAKAFCHLFEHAGIFVRELQHVFGCVLAGEIHEGNNHQDDDCDEHRPEVRVQDALCRSLLSIGISIKVTLQARQGVQSEPRHEEDNAAASRDAHSSGEDRNTQLKRTAHHCRH
jgi:hypothetical protein